MLDLELLLVALLGFLLALVPFVSIALFLPVETGMFTLWHCVLAMFNTHFDFMGLEVNRSLYISWDLDFSAM